ncbi:aldo/keto reductase [Xanthobacter sp. KR7-65]|uniref:aldo/keto reductase family protein n=1 Tax=Xanthobacter sp. KR7-65 TaxID=3156612 RepID=UPI0032B5F3AA
MAAPKRSTTKASRPGARKDAPEAERVIVSAAGVALPRILYGTAWKKERTAALVEEALRAGFRGIDTACQPKHYHEPGVGEALGAVLGSGPGATLKRADIYVQTKFTPFRGQDPDNVPYNPKARLADQVRQSFAVSLANLRTDHLDGLVLHSPYPRDRDTLTVWCAMEELHDAGGVRQLGISNCYEPDRLERIYDAARIKPAVVQNRFYAKTGFDQEIRAFCRSRGIVYQSFWTLTANPAILAAPALTDLAAQLGRTPAQVFFRYLTQQDMACLTGTSSPEHMAQDLAIFDFRLDNAACASIAALLR